MLGKLEKCTPIISSPFGERIKVRGKYSYPTLTLTLSRQRERGIYGFHCLIIIFMAESLLYAYSKKIRCALLNFKSLKTVHF
jgi:hypothetical protein